MASYMDSRSIHEDQKPVAGPSTLATNRAYEQGGQARATAEPLPSALLPDADAHTRKTWKPEERATLEEAIRRFRLRWDLIYPVLYDNIDRKDLMAALFIECKKIWAERCGEEERHTVWRKTL